MSSVTSLAFKLFFCALSMKLMTRQEEVIYAFSNNDLGDKLVEVECHGDKNA